MTTPVKDQKEITENQTPPTEKLASNWELLTQIDSSIGVVKTIYGFASAGAITFLVAGGLWYAALFGSIHQLYSSLSRISKLSNLKRVLTHILEDFKEQEELKIYGCLPIEGEEPLDLFATISKKANFFISVRSKGKSRLFYDSEKDWFYGKRKGKTRSKWKSHLVNEMITYMKWVNKNRKLFNISSRQMTRVPHARIVVVCNPTEIAGHEDQYYSIMNGEKVLTVNKTFFVGEENVTKLMKAFLDNQIEYPTT